MWSMTSRTRKTTSRRGQPTNSELTIRRNELKVRRVELGKQRLDITKRRNAITKRRIEHFVRDVPSYEPRRNQNGVVKAIPPTVSIDENGVKQNIELIFLAFDGCFACSQDVDNRCGDSHWRAANNHGRKAAKLDESGLEIAGCRHGLAQWAVNIFQGELYVYANFIHKKKMIPAGVKYLWEDIVCKYWKWAGKAGGLENCDMKPALSVMQAKAHSWRCQVIWGGRWQDGSARDAYFKTMLIFGIEVESYQGTSSSIRLQDEIEMLVSTLEQTSHTMNKLDESSKQRTRLRCKISTEKAKVTSRIQQYNEQTQCDQVSNLQSTSTVSEVMKGNLPLEGSAATPIRIQRIMIERHQISRRWDEEIALFKKEMANFIAFHLEVAIPNLERAIMDLKDKLESKYVEAS
ncbi:hypothetical protein AWC38_SpisGene22393 [Stylophora pistillata]|uniref:Uncharacterized protein n=1 Tax=Stylophora pistillata TaxID=50429 RepID=A0A2B4R8P1_STYPI|nr:hypothetical protein AWC38_SpisGene22393 [Stylophora pistillata]